MQPLNECAVRLFFGVIFLLLRSVMITVIVVQSVVIFNDFTGPLYFLPGDENATVQLTLYNFQGQFNTQYNLLFMKILLITIPPHVHLLQPPHRRGNDGWSGEGSTGRAEWTSNTTPLSMTLKGTR